MAKLPWILLIVLTSFIGPALGDDSKVKSWKAFSSDYGYEFKYPNCWTIVPDNPDEWNTPVAEAHEIALQESKQCARPLFNPPHQNGLGFSAGRIKTPPKKEVLNEIAQIDKHSGNNILRKEWLYSKHLNNGDNEAYVYVQFYKEVDYTWIRWQMTLYCPTYEVTYAGPSIKNPEKEYFDRFKAGDIALPEPERAIFDSIRCVKSKK